MKTLNKTGQLKYGRILLGWAIEFGNLKDETIFVKPEDMHSFTCSETEKELKLQWKGCKLAGDDFTVNLLWKKFQGGWQGSIAYEGNASRLFVERLHFPVADMPFPHPNAHLLVGVEQGWIYSHKDTDKDGELRRGNFFNGLQMALLMSDDDSCVYFDHRDASHNLKEYAWYKNGNTLSYHGILSMPCNAKTRKSGGTGYESTIIAYKGTWYQAAQYYRQWAIEQPTYKRRIKHNKMRDIAIWLWNRGAIDYVIPPAEKLQKDAGVPVALDWYWWHGNPYDTNYPHYWPPREGITAFKKAVHRLNRQHIYAQVYVNGVAWDIESPSYLAENGEKDAIINRNGTPRAIEYNHYTGHKLASCCGEGRTFQAKIRQIVKNLTSCGLPGVYLDMIGMSLGHNCYNPAHSHAPGGGSYHIRGYRKYVKQIRQENPGIVLSTESTNENYLDLFESNIVLSSSLERNGAQEWLNCVPVFSAVYHGACALFGNFALPDGIPCWDSLWPPKEKWNNERDWNKVCPYQFYLELARTVIWGMQPTVCNFQMKHTEGEYAPLYEYIKNIARFYYENRKFLYDGRMLDPKTLECSQLDIQFLYRATFTTEKESYLTKRRHPAVLHSCWEAPDDEKALILINYTDKPQKCLFAGKSYTVPARTPMKVTV